ncbi:type II secretion system F family protein [Amycolatopsis keratiniphila]|uniref:type II secretion system F family protein n=1 Tax=Amycolatopsis keratiniphila TaxID=129921 RepID=UPI00087C6BB4|nr:type II secretion system F family protein [Amycolatopsis keratiniphila]OLZ45966.1 pilus assembly protein TadB [Amycolatopsis keratiniphila subsp. nogabecina]SDU12094.1 Flp pilus assembly protein TadB [Amycolatopsis keratiniphila]
MTGVWAGLLGVAAAAAIACAVAAFRPPAARSATPRKARRAGWKTFAARVPRRRVVVAVTAGGVVWWGTGWPVAIILTVAVVLTVPILARGHDARRVIARLDALASWVRRLADVLASGAGGLEQAITTSARTAPEALASEVETLAVRLRTRGLEAALRAFAEDVGDEAADEVVLALILRARAGGRGLVDILDSKATALEREVVARRDIEADRAKPRTDVRAILGITALLLTGLVVFAHEFLSPFNDLLGQLVMGGIGGLLGAAGWWMHLLTRTRRPARLLGAASRIPPGAPKPKRTPIAAAHVDVEVPR